MIVLMIYITKTTRTTFCVFKIYIFFLHMEAISDCLPTRYLDGQAKFYRQSIILGSHLNPGTGLGLGLAEYFFVTCRVTLLITCTDKRVVEKVSAKF